MTSRNLEPKRAFGQIKELLGNKPLMLDLEFSYEELFPEEEGVRYVVRLNLGSRPNGCRREQASA